MCFTENQSYLNTIILIIGGLYVLPNYRLSIGLFFLAIKDLIQGLSYYNLRKNQSTEFLTTLSWIHISLQPFFINLFISHFDKKFKYWNIIFLICILFALYNITILKKFDIQNDGICEKKNRFLEPAKEDDFCSEKNEIYIGKYHVGYKFKTDNTLYPYYYPLLPLLLILPSLFTKSKYLGLIFGLFVGIIYIIFGNIGGGEAGAIWCFLSIILALPVALFHKKISRFI